MTGESLKRNHERAVGEQLLKAIGEPGTFKRLGNDQDEPDLFFDIGGREVGIEIATAYYENSDAKDEWTLARGERAMPKEGFEPRSGGVLVNPDDLICKRIQQEITDKCGKKYSAGEIWLCIEQRAALSDAKSIEACLGTLNVPSGHGFAHIYLTYQAPLHDGGEYAAFQLA